jgi:hypothetical protein
MYQVDVVTTGRNHLRAWPLLDLAALRCIARTFWSKITAQDILPSMLAMARVARRESHLLATEHQVSL